MNEDKLTEEQLNAISDSILKGRKIDAIKAFREATDLGLKEAKDEIEKITLELSKEHPELLQKQPKGCAGIIALGLALGYGATELIGNLIIG